MHNYSDYYYDEDEVQYLRFRGQAIKRYQGKLSRFPDCRDPDHPGCDKCEEDWEDFDE